MKILIRSRQDPFTPVSAERTYTENLIGNNVGNLVFSHAAHRLLSVEGAEIRSNGFRAVADDAPQINEQYDVFVIPLANAFRPSFRGNLDRLSELVERLTIPVVVLGVGAQAGTGYDATRLKSIDTSVSRFTKAVLDRSASIGVRGEFTKEYLNRLGFRDVEVIGCPSLFMRGPDLRIEKDHARLRRRSRLAVNISPYVHAMGPITMAAYDRYPNLVYVVQDRKTLGLMLKGDDDEDLGMASAVPVHESHELYREDKMRFFLSPWTWLDFLSTRDFSFGTRIHGNIASIVAGTPALVLAHDSRTLELARYHDIPHRLISQVPSDVDPADLYARADFSAFNSGHRARFEQFAGYLERNGLRHVYAGGRVDPGAGAFDARVAAVTWPAPVRPGRPSESRLGSAARSRHAARTRHLVRRVARRTGFRR